VDSMHILKAVIAKLSKRNEKVVE
jgi:hypothetical protein